MEVKLIETVKELRTQFIDLQVALFLDQLHEGYAERMSFDVTDEARCAVIDFTRGTMQDRIRDIDVLLGQLRSMCGISDDDDQ